MPLGIIVNFTAILLGGLFGALSRNRIPDKIKSTLPVIFATCALSLAITLIVQVKNIQPVVLALILGTAIGELLNIEGGLRDLSIKLQTKLQKGKTKINEKTIEGFITLLVLFSANAGIIIGALYEGMTGDTTLLVIKSILDFFTAMIFATTIGYIIMFISLPTLVVGTLFFSLATLILPYINEVMTADFIACGGIITLLVGIQMMELKKVPVANTIPTILLVMPFSYLWALIF